MTYRFSSRSYRLPFLRPVRTAHGIWTEREGLIIRLEDEKGAVGWGEAGPLPGFGTETLAEIAAACATLGPEPDEAALADVPARLGCLRSALNAAGVGHAPSSSRSESEAASSRRSEAEPDGSAPGQQPSRQNPAAPAYLPVAALLPAGRAALATIVPLAEAGFRAFKWKVGVGDGQDERVLLDDLCAVLPTGAQLRLDANGAWDRRGAERWLECCADRPIEYVEQPIAPTTRGAEDLLLGLAADHPTPLALDESLIGCGDVDHWLGLGWRGVFVVKPTLLGGTTDALGRLAAARAAVVFSSALETAVGAQAALRLAFSWTGPVKALSFGVWPLFANPIFNGPTAAPFVRREDVERIDPEAVWNALN